MILEDFTTKTPRHQDTKAWCLGVLVVKTSGLVPLHVALERAVRRQSALALPVNHQSA